MKSITTAIARTVATAALRRSWDIESSSARRQARGERMEAWAERLAVRWGCVDDVTATVTCEALRSR
jgi:hypothetical protein